VPAARWKRAPEDCPLFQRAACFLAELIPIQSPAAAHSTATRGGRPKTELPPGWASRASHRLRNEFGSVALRVAPGEPDSFPLASYLEESTCFDTDFAVSRAARTAATPRSFAACVATPAAFFRSELRSFTSLRLRVAAAFFAEALRWAFVCLLNFVPFGSLGGP
jgi:hypothetical protein